MSQNPNSEPWTRDPGNKTIKLHNVNPHPSAVNPQRAAASPQAWARSSERWRARDLNVLCYAVHGLLDIRRHLAHPAHHLGPHRAHVSTTVCTPQASRYKRAYHAHTSVLARGHGGTRTRTRQYGNRTRVSVADTHLVRQLPVHYQRFLRRLKKTKSLPFLTATAQMPLSCNRQGPYLVVHQGTVLVLDHRDRVVQTSARKPWYSQNPHQYQRATSSTRRRALRTN
eukprot:2775600-Rhodomonas_salina.1